VAGPYFEELHRGQRAEAPGLTLTAGHAALHQAIVGDRLPLFLDAGLAASVVGTDAPLVHPALVWDVAIGQSTVLTQRVVANLFYRGLVLRRLPVVGDTLHTTTEVVALRENARREGRRATGMAVLRVRTVDQAGRVVLEFWRCAMLPLGDAAAATGCDDDLAAIPERLDDGLLRSLTAGWDLGGLHGAEDLVAGRRWSVGSGDVVSGAPELARLTLNVAAVHHDRFAAGARRLVYGGHTIGIAAAQLSRAVPSLLTIVGWHGCDHPAPVHEDDTLVSDIEVQRVEPLQRGGRLVHLRSVVRRRGGDFAAAETVLDWRLVGVCA
jgi:acyl dehydratase